MADKPYLFPTPGRTTRRNLDLRAQVGEPFDDDDATADVMLDLDLIRFYGRKPQPTGLLHAYRYYAKRWGWPVSRVAEAWAGSPERQRPNGTTRPAVAAWLQQRADDWRDFYKESLDAESGRQWQTVADKGQTKSTPDAPEKPGWQTPADSGRQVADKQEQTSRPSDSERGGDAGAGAPGAKPGGACWEHPAVVAYAESAGEPGAPWWMPEANANQIARRFGLDPKPDLIRTLSEFVAAYRASDWKVRNVPTVLRAFDEHLNRLATPDRPERPGRRRPNNPAGSDDLGAAFARNAELAARALGLEPGGVE